jgi:hypothetical protein
MKERREMRTKKTLPIVLLLLLAVAYTGVAQAQQGPTFTIGGTTYTKWLWGNSRYQGALYSFKDAPGEGEGLEGRRGQCPDPQPLLPELLDEHGRLGQPVGRQGLQRLRDKRRLR